jgi:hypothetical protein
MINLKKIAEGGANSAFRSGGVQKLYFKSNSMMRW